MNLQFLSFIILRNNCSDEPRVEPTSNCTTGFFCPGGDAVPSYACSKNHYCPEGSINETVCEAGTYQPREGEGSCINCPVGSICDPSDGKLPSVDVKSLNHATITMRITIVHA